MRVTPASSATMGSVIPFDILMAAKTTTAIKAAKRATTTSSTETNFL